MSKTIWQTLLGCAYLMRLHRPAGTLLLLWPTLWALWIAGEGSPDPWLVLIFITGVFLMRSAGCVINDIADRNFDGKVARTKDRPLATGMVSVRVALGLFICLSLSASLLLWPLNALTRALAVVALMLAMSYPFAKRWTHFPQVILGLAFSWGIPMAFAAQMGTVPFYSWLLFLVAVLWSVAYDTMYAMVDQEDDQKIGVKSTAIIFGDWSSAMIALLHSSMILILLVTGVYLEFGWAYYVGLCGATGMMMYLQYLVRLGRSATLFRAFCQSHWVGCAIFMGMLLS